jgi:hypothetical protein
MDWLSLGTQPSGGAAGMFYMGKNQNEQAKWDIEQALRQLEAEKQRMALEKTRQTQGSDIERILAENRATAQTIGRQKEATTSQEEDKAFISRGSRDATLQDTMGKYESADQQRKAENLNRAVEVLGALDETMFDSPNWQADLERLSKEHKVPPQVYQMLKQSRNPAELKQRIAVLKDRASQSLAHTREMEKINTKELSDFQRADMTSARQLEGVKYTADARERIAQAREEKANGYEKTAQMHMEKGIALELKGDKPGAEQQYALANRYHIMAQQLRSAGAPMMPTIPGLPMEPNRASPQNIPGGGGTNAPSTSRQYDAQGNRIK